MTKIEYEKVADAWAKASITLGILRSVQNGETELFVDSEWLDKKGTFDIEKVIRFTIDRLIEIHISLDKLLITQPDDKKGRKCSK